MTLIMYIFIDFKVLLCYFLQETWNEFELTLKFY